METNEVIETTVEQVTDLATTNKGGNFWKNLGIATGLMAAGAALYKGGSWVYQKIKNHHIEKKIKKAKPANVESEPEEVDPNSIDTNID